MAEHEMIIRTLFLLDEGININANNIARFSPCWEVFFLAGLFSDFSYVGIIV